MLGVGTGHFVDATRFPMFGSRPRRTSWPRLRDPQQRGAGDLELRGDLERRDPREALESTTAVERRAIGESHRELCAEKWASPAGAGENQRRKPRVCLLFEVPHNDIISFVGASFVCASVTSLLGGWRPNRGWPSSHLRSIFGDGVESDAEEVRPLSLGRSRAAHVARHFVAPPSVGSAIVAAPGELGGGIGSRRGGTASLALPFASGESRASLRWRVTSERSAFVAAPEALSRVGCGSIAAPRRGAVSPSAVGWMRLPTCWSATSLTPTYV